MMAAPSGLRDSPGSEWAEQSRANPVRAGGEAALIKTRRERDCLFFEPDGSPLLDDTGSMVLPGETVVPLVSVEHVWLRGRGRDPTGPAPRAGDPHTWKQGGQDAPKFYPCAAGVSLKLIQVIVVTERARSPRLMIDPFLAGLPAGMVRAEGSSLDGCRPKGPASPPSIARSAAAESRRRAAVRGSVQSPRGGSLTEGKTKGALPGSSRAWVPSASDIIEAIGKLRRTIVPDRQRPVFGHVRDGSTDV